MVMVFLSLSTTIAADCLSSAMPSGPQDTKSAKANKTGFLHEVMVASFHCVPQQLLADGLLQCVFDRWHIRFIDGLIAERRSHFGFIGHHHSYVGIGVNGPIVWP